MKAVRALIPWALPLALLALWQLAGDAGWFTRRVLPTPAEVVRAGVRLAESGELSRHLAVSAKRAASGFIIGGAIGFVLGLFTGASRVAESVLDSSVQMLRTVPHLALVPLVILWFGIGEGGKVFLVALGVLFPVYLNTYHGIRSVDPGLIEMGRVYGLGRWGLFRRVLLPGALPSILVGVRYALGVMWLTLIVAETIAANSGIGYMAMNAREFLLTDVVVLSILLYALLGKLADLAARGLERWLLPWHPAHARKTAAAALPDDPTGGAA
ncbi:aliphatic sulfonate ABC transporter permease SsuC [Frigoriglobus tundricola]|uniref:Alkanesulfonate ABC transporter permease protein SsuC n=1 Tax=Frigoriglobus tundricola TaxID=2774151 RepID=A0A6M5Z6Z6_9BACT|nr:aliphatic sulfonate ABC transporter permease SsuC [Frigoriglobus tundricola]QJX01131.1 Alkanesulfonate ABC transporter permease protein SsuC [Frigoriglobus tundricola]